MFDRFSEAAKIAIMFARIEAGNVGAEKIDTEHLLGGLLHADATTFEAVAPALTIESLRTRAAGWHSPGTPLPRSADMPLSEEAKQALTGAGASADKYACESVRTEHLLLALMLQPSCHAAKVLADEAASIESLEGLIAALPKSREQAISEASRAQLSVQLHCDAV